MSDHSPGPWKVYERGPWIERLGPGKSKEHWKVVGPNGDAQTNIATCASNAMGIDNEANARLIALAPELLSALKEALPIVAWDVHPDADDLFRQIHELIAKAEGRS